MTRVARRALVAALAGLLAAVVGLAAIGDGDPEPAPAPARAGATGDATPRFAPDYSKLSGASVYASVEQLKRGWQTDFSKRTVRLSEFQRGGPGRDGIAAVDDPLRIPVADVDFLPDDEPVVELIVDGVARAYPFGALVRHEIVNDTVAGVPVVVTFCPLCNTALVFDRRVGGRTLTFGATGSLRRADLVMYDRQTESWWQQFGGEALVGHYAGAELRRLPSRGRRLAEFAAEHPDGVLVTSRASRELGYGRNPYLGTLHPDTPSPFPVPRADDRRLPPSERVVLVERGDEAVAVPFSRLEREGELQLEIGGDRLVVRLDGVLADVRDADGRVVLFTEPFWFSVAAFRPDVRIAR